MEPTSRTPIADLTARQAKLPPRSRCLSPAQAEEVYGVSRRALKRAWQERRLPIYKLGHRSILIDARDVEAFLNRCRVDAVRV